MSTSLTLTDIKNCQQLCELLLKFPRYQKMGLDQIFLVVSTARSLGIDPIMALSGGLWCLNGKIEMSSRLMNALIHSKKHIVIVSSKESNENVCVVQGKRSDTGATSKASFSLEDAQRAGLMSNPTWKKYPEDMLFARALSRLARRLFPDVIGNCYVEGELSGEFKDEKYMTDAECNIIDAAVESIKKKDLLENPSYPINEFDYQDLMELLDQLPDYKNELIEFLRKRKINSFREISLSTYKTILNNAKAKLQDQVIDV